MKDGFALFYIKEGTLYPTALTREQYEMLNILVGGIGTITIVGDKPMGEAIDMIEEKKERERKIEIKDLKIGDELQNKRSKLVYRINGFIGNNIAEVFSLNYPGVIDHINSNTIDEYMLLERDNETKD